MSVAEPEGPRLVTPATKAVAVGVTCTEDGPVLTAVVTNTPGIFPPLLMEQLNENLSDYSYSSVSSVATTVESSEAPSAGS